MSSSPLARLLIVDDETALVTALCRTLQAEGYSTTGATSGPEALATLRAAAADRAALFDVLITDLMMPEMDGIALLHAARQIDTHLVGIVMTGYGTIDTAVEAMKSGALDYILKPFNLTAIMPVLSRALTVRSLRLANSDLLQCVADRSAELDAATQELRSVNEEVKAHMYSVSHELREPLNEIVSFAGLLVDGKTGPLNAEQKKLLDRIYSGGQQLLRFSDDLPHVPRLRPLEKQP
jgi:two-component system sensor histidine kinase/response regulator